MAGALPVHDSGHSSKLLLGDLTLPESALRVQPPASRSRSSLVQVQVQHVQVLILVHAPPPRHSLCNSTRPCRNETPDFLFHASVCRSERQTILPLSITWSRSIGRLVAHINQAQKSLHQADLTQSLPLRRHRCESRFTDPALPYSWDRSKASQGSIPARGAH